MAYAELGKKYPLIACRLLWMQCGRLLRRPIGLSFNFPVLSCTAWLVHWTDWQSAAHRTAQHCLAMFICNQQQCLLLFLGHQYTERTAAALQGFRFCLLAMSWASPIHPACRAFPT